MIGFVKCGIYEKLTEHLSNEIPSYIKKKINLLYNSDIVEEKQFISYNI